MSQKQQQNTKTGCGCRYEGKTLCQICPSEVEDKFNDLEEKARVALCSDQKVDVLGKICAVYPAKNFLSCIILDISEATGVDENTVAMFLTVAVGLFIYHLIYNKKQQQPYGMRLY